MAKEFDGAKHGGDQKPGGQRLLSLDAYRGFIMLAMVSAGMSMQHIRRDPSLAQSWHWLAEQLEHREWLGCTFWDLIQPSFMFIVGIAMPLAFGVRQSQGESWGRQFLHAFKRAGLLLIVGIFLDAYANRVYEYPPPMIRVLQQIAIGYLIAFLVLHLGPRIQAATLVFLLVGHTAAFLIYGKARGVEPWNASDNFGTFFDTLVRLGPYRGNYVTFNAISSAATILLGVLCGELLRSSIPAGRKVTFMLLFGLIGLAAGWALSGGNGWVAYTFQPLVPMIKRLWTASFAVYAAGWTFLMMAGFFLVIEVLGLKSWTFPLVVVGMNSIAMYVAVEILRLDVRRAILAFFPDLQSYTSPYPVYYPVILSALVLFVFWLFCLWLYRHKIFFKV